MKKNRLLIAASIATVAAVVTLWLGRGGESIAEDRDFAVKDTAAITRIFLSDRAANSVLLSRQPGASWMVNDSIKAKAETIRQLLDVIYRVEVRNRVPKSRYNTIIKELAARGIKCEIYLEDDERPVKTYYVGGQTEDALGTYMMLEHSEVPFVTEIPGFNGYLTPWYPTKIGDWKDRIFFAFSPEEIASVNVAYPAFPQHSFTLKRESAGFLIASPAVAGVTTVTDTVALANYLALFRSVPYENIDKVISDGQKDSIRMTPPAVVYEITDTKGNTNRILLHPMPLNEYSLTREDSTGAPLKYDLDRMLGWLEKDRQWVTVQHFTFDPLLRKYADFTRSAGKSTAIGR